MLSRVSYVHAVRDAKKTVSIKQPDGGRLRYFRVVIAGGAVCSIIVIFLETA